MKLHRLVSFCTVMLVATLGLASPASAASAQDQAAADVLFKEAKQLAAAKDWEHAIPKFQESQRLDPSTGTLLNIGDSYEKMDKLASAYGAFREAEVSARNAGDTGRQGEAARRAEFLAPKLAKLAIVVPPVAHVPGFEVHRDGSVVGEGQWGSSLPTDVGFHTIEASAPGHKAWSTTVRIDINGSAASVEIPPLDTLPVEAPPTKPGFTWSTQRSVGVVLGVVGLAGLGVAAGFTVNAASKNLASLPYCQPTNVTMCTAPGVTLRNQAFDAAHVATGTLVAGSAVVVSGLVVFLTASNGAPKKPDEQVVRPQVGPIVGPGLAGIALQGVW